MTDPEKHEPQEPGLLAHVGSVLAAFFGVQSNRARERDFTKGKPSTYIILGIVLTIVFILVIFGVVKLVLSLSGV
ncbi:MAG: DUF2970 domain-containing protein [Gammaproteobacteria bacterium]|jgi:hypothetical protein